MVRFSRFASRCLALSLSAIALVAAAGSAQAADLTVNVAGLRSKEGTVMLALFDRADGFPRGGKPLQGRMVAASQATPSVVFSGLAAGRYAVVAYHDENGNGKLDSNMVGVPVEPLGFSNNAVGAAAAPGFDAAAVEVRADVAITINLR